MLFTSIVQDFLFLNNLKYYLGELKDEERTEEILSFHPLRLQRVTDAVHILSRDSHDVLPAFCQLGDLEKEMWH